MIVFAKGIYLAKDSPDFELDLWSASCLLLIMAAFWNPISSGWADGSGIHYLRYFRVKTVPWSNVKEIQRRGYQLLVVRKEGNSLFKRTMFLLNPLNAMSSYSTQRLGKDGGLPEAIERINAIPKEEVVPIVTAPPLIKWRLRVFAAFGLFFLLIVLMRLVLAFLH